MPVTSLAFDPGAQGGFVALAPQSPDRTYVVLRAAWWRRASAGGWLVDLPQEGLQRARVASLGAVAGLCLDGLPLARAAAVEGLYVPTETVVVRGRQRLAVRNEGNLRGALTLAELAGPMVDALRARGLEPHRPNWAQWSGPFRFKPGPKKALDAHAVKVAGRVLRGLGPLASNVHVAEAGLMAVWVDQVARQEHA